MSISSFEQDLINKLNYKASSKVSTDAVLFKAFKFFDLNNVGYVPKNEFFRTIAKIGVIIDNPQQMQHIFSYYDKGKQGKIYYGDFIENILFKNTSEVGSSKSRSAHSSYQQSSTPSIKQRKIQKVQVKQSLKQKQSPQQISQFVKQKLKQSGVTGLLKLAVNMKNLDKQRTHHLSLPKYELIFNYLSHDEIKTFFKLFGTSQNGQVNYAQIAYHIRGKQSEQTEDFLTQLFNSFDIHKQGQINIEQFVQKLYQYKQEQSKINESISLYCKFQGIDDGVFTLDDFLDFYGFLQFNFDTDRDFEKFVRQGKIQKPQRSVASSSKHSRRQYDNSHRSGLDKANQGVHHHDFRKNKQQQQHYQQYVPAHQNQDALSQDFSSSEDKISRKSMRSKASSQLSAATTMKNVIERIRGSLVNKGTMRFLLFEKALRGVDFDQDSFINLPELRKVIKDFRIGISDIEAQILFQNFDLNGVGLMSYPQLVFQVRGETPEHRNKVILRIWQRVKETEQHTTFSKLKSIFQPRAHPDLKIAKRHEQDIYKQFIDTLFLIQDLNGTRSEQIDKDSFIEYLQNVSASIDDDKFFDVAMIGLWKLTNQTKIQDQYAGSKKKFETGKKAYLQDFHKSTVVGGSSADHAPFGTFKGPVNYTTQHRAAYEI